MTHFNKNNWFDVSIYVTLFVSLQSKQEDEWNLVIATHGLVKKTQKTPESEIAHAEALRKNYYNEKKK